MSDQYPIRLHAVDGNLYASRPWDEMMGRSGERAVFADHFGVTQSASIGTFPPSETGCN